MQRYFELFDNYQSMIQGFFPGYEDSRSELEIAVERVVKFKLPLDEDVLLAYYDYADYSGRAFVL